MNRNFGLDLVRALSIWLVILQHSGLKPFDLQIGMIGVEVFFVLSGFLIGQILIKEVGKDNSFHSLKKFWIRRWFRILPLYYLMLTISFIWFDHVDVGWNIVYYITFLQNNFYGIGFYPVTWSLVIEEWFYLLAPLYIMAVWTYNKDHMARLRWLLAFILGIIIMRTAWAWGTNAPYAGLNGNFPFRMDSLFVGVTIAYLKTALPGAYKVLQSRWIFLLGLACLLGYVATMAILPKREFMDSLLTKGLGFFAFSLFIGLMIPLIEKLQSISRKGLLRNSLYQFITWTSLLTYALYLVHNKVNVFFYTEDDMWGHDFVLATLISYAAAFLLYKYFERPMMNIRERFK